jgi:hypothetical protein
MDLPLWLQYNKDLVQSITEKLNHLKITTEE